MIEQLALREKTTDSAIFGAVTYRELKRLEYLEARDYATVGMDGMVVGIEKVDRWNVARFCAGVTAINGLLTVFRHDDLFNLPSRADLWEEIERIADAISELSEVSPGALKSGDHQNDTGRAARSD